jgi:hypothetical protein
MVEAATFSQVLPAARCRIELLLNQDGALRGPLARRQRRAQRWGRPPGGPHLAGHTDQTGSHGTAAGAAQGAVVLGSDCPARGHRVKIASGVAVRSLCDQLR